MFAAASLTDSFNDDRRGVHEANPDAKVTFSFDASSALVQQITQGAPADVFASADTGEHGQADRRQACNGTEPVIFATNLLGIIVAPGNPKGITGVADLANAGPEGRALRPRGAVRQVRQADPRQRRRHGDAR